MDKNIVYQITCDLDYPQENFKLTGGGMDIFNAGEIGIWCSIVSIWKIAIKNDYRNTIVFEDDFVARPNNFIEMLNYFIASLPKNTYDLAYIDVWHSAGYKIPLSNDLNHISSFSPGSIWAGTWAHVFSNNFAKKALSADLYIRSLDQYLYSQGTSNSVINKNKPLEIYVSSFNLSATNPEALSGHNAESTISEMGCRQYHEDSSLDCRTDSILINEV